MISNGNIGTVRNGVHAPGPAGQVAAPPTFRHLERSEIAPVGIQTRAAWSLDQRGLAARAARILSE